MSANNGRRRYNPKERVSMLGQKLLLRCLMVAASVMLVVGTVGCPKKSDDTSGITEPAQNAPANTESEAAGGSGMPM